MERLPDCEQSLNCGNRSGRCPASLPLLATGRKYGVRALPIRDAELVGGVAWQERQRRRCCTRPPPEFRRGRTRGRAGTRYAADTRAQSRRRSRRDPRGERDFPALPPQVRDLPLPDGGGNPRGDRRAPARSPHASCEAETREGRGEGRSRDARYRASFKSSVSRPVTRPTAVEKLFHSSSLSERVLRPLPVSA